MDPSFQKRVTVRRIAERLGVSHTTVSRSLRNDPRISASMRQTVRQAADEMGYRPDPMLAALSNYRRRNPEQTVKASLAWVNCWPEPGRLRTFKEFDLYWKGAVAEARRHGYRLDEFNCPGEIPPNRLMQILRARGVRGILLPPGWAGGAPKWGALDWNDFAVVRFGYSLVIPPTHLVAADQMSNGMLAYEKMRAHGCRRIGMVMFKTQGTRLVRFAAGYLYAQLDMGSKRLLPPLSLEEVDSEADQRALAAWLKRVGPDAILTDIPQLGNMLKRAGVRVPKDVGLASLSVLDGNVDAGIYQNSDEVGAAAVQLVISLIQSNQFGIPAIPREVLVPGRWVNGRSLPQRP